MQLARGIASRRCPTPVPKLKAGSGRSPPPGPEASGQERDRGPCGVRRGPGPRGRRM